jgi:NADH:ubiquinone oxidoreductase subunit H
VPAGLPGMGAVLAGDLKRLEPGGNGMSWHRPETIAILWAVVKAIVILLVVVIFAAYLSFIERRCWRCGRTATAPTGSVPSASSRCVADMLKMFFKEDWTPPFADADLPAGAGASR